MPLTDWLKRFFGSAHSPTDEVAQARALIRAIDAGGVPLNPVRVNAIAPGYVSGGLPSRVLDGDNLKAVEAKYLVTQALPRLLQVNEVAGLAYFLVAGAPGITGEVIRMDNGLHLYA